jgi:hypothetical protein
MPHITRVEANDDAHHGHHLPHMRRHVSAEPRRDSERRLEGLPEMLAAGVGGTPVRTLRAGAQDGRAHRVPRVLGMAL